MTEVTSEAVLAAFLVFCRVGSCLMVAPGFASARIPMSIRLFLAIAVSLALTPLMRPQLAAAMSAVDVNLRIFLAGSETLNGIIIGLMGRMFLLALQFGATVMANAAGLSNIPGIPLEGAEPEHPLVSLITLPATALIFIAGLHAELLLALAQSYTALPPRIGIDANWYLTQAGERLGDTFLLSLRLCSPFIVYAIIVNLAIGIANKLTPQISVYFASTALVIAGGLFLLWITIGEWLSIFTSEYTSWLLNG
jgi:flagellar biosynthesis protein FliR